MSRRIALVSGATFFGALLVSLLITQLVQPASAAGGAAAVQAGGGHSCALTTTGGVKCWGANGSGQLGNGAAEDQPLPIDVYTCVDLPDTVAGGLPPECIPLTGVDAVTTGYTHTCALHDSRIALCWGRNQYGQLGDATTGDRAVAAPVCAGGAGVAGSATSCCPITPSPTPSATAGTVTPAATPTATATRMATPTMTPVPALCGALSGVVEVSAGVSHTCALTADSSVWCWGENSFGQLGNGTALNSSLPVHVCASAPAGAAGSPSCPPFTGVAAIRAGSHHTCARMVDGGAACWGNNSSGQLGNGTFDDSSFPIRACAAKAHTAGRWIAGACAGLSAVRALTTGGLHTCAVMNDGALLCWGENSSGQMADGTSFDRPVPVTACAIGVSAAAAAGVSTPGCCVVVATGNAAGAEPCSLRGVSSASAGGEHTCAILEGAGNLLCWGSNTAGQLGSGTTVDASLPVAVCLEPLTAGAGCGAFSNAERVSAGTEHTCARTAAGGVFCWGAGSEGQIGDGATANRDRPAEVTGFSGKPTPTPTRTPTATLTATPTGTRTPIVTAQATATVTHTLTPTPTPTAPPGATDTPTRTSTPLPSLTNTPTRTTTGTPTRTPTMPVGLIGDVNCDGQATAVDSALILQLVAALIDSVACPNNIDVNGDGTIDPIDSALILQYTAGLIPSL